jgi:hypothetical protein
MPITLDGTNGITTPPTLVVQAGTTTAAPLDFTAGTNLTTPLAGAVEFDGVNYYATVDTISGRGFVNSSQLFRLTANGSAIGPTIADYFGATSSITLAAGGVYEIEYYLYFTKTTANTVTFTLTAAQAPVNLNAYYVGTPVGGVGTAGTAQTAAIVASTSTTSALPATGSLTTGVNHQYVVKAIVEGNATTAGILELQVTSASGTVTPLRGSYYKVTRLAAGNVGTFA